MSRYTLSYYECVNPSCRWSRKDQEGMRVQAVRMGARTGKARCTCGALYVWVRTETTKHDPRKRDGEVMS